jgi:ectoine hydroxylase-related dioxygenase (phytanoyl-CoA dioxygenase family)
MSGTVQTKGYVPFIESDPQSDAAQLRATMDTYGYLFFRGLVSADEVLAVRHDVLETLREAKWLDPSRDLMEGIARPGLPAKTEGQPEYTAVYRQVLRLPRFHNFPCHASLMSIARHLIDGEILVHPRRIGRITFPGSQALTTPAHQDHFYIRGSVETYSCWVPLGDCPMALGGLAIWPGTHRRGFIEHSVSHPGTIGGRGVPVDEAQAEWHTTDFQIGDALFFHSYTIHKALPNLSPERLRLSTDNRYQRSEDKIDPAALRPHFDGR